MELYLVATLYYIAFALFHSITAHEVFKRWVARWTGEYFVEHFWRLIYCVVSYVLLYHVFVTSVYKYESFVPVVEYPLWVWNILAVVKMTGLIVNYWAFLQLDYLEFWGFKQAWRGVRDWKNPAWRPIPLAGVDRLEVKGIYHFCRHPALAGGFLFVLAMPPYRLFLLFALYYFIYMVIGAYFEERRLISHFGDQYRDYRREVGAFWPSFRQLKRVIYRFCRPFSVSSSILSTLLTFGLGLGLGFGFTTGFAGAFGGTAF